MSVLDNIKAFWSRFEDEQGSLLEALKTKDYEKISEIMEMLNEETNRISGAHFFVEDNFEEPEMTFDSGPNKTSQLICQQMKKLAPSSIKKIWIINDTLPPLSQKAIEADLQIKDEHYSLFDMTAFYTVNLKSHSFEVKVYCPGFSLIENPEYKREMCIYLVELAVGENCLESYISNIDFLDQPENGVDFCNLTELYEVIMDTAEKEKWQDYKHPLDIYTVFKPHQDFASDSLRKDMKMIFTVHPALVEETLGNKGDVQLDLQSKEGEYGYIYYNNPFDNEQDAAFRQELSKQIEALLAPLHYGKVIGGAIGKSYSYIDLILFDPAKFEQVFKQIQEQLKGKVELYYRAFTQEA
ncbi:hypothetical protein IM774_05960 [Erysipelotrichaceae bacterium RD49]|nr:hypothetical protein [Erysipelotrichaceae bacterium RD49]